LAFGAWIGVLMIVIASVRKTSSNVGCELRVVIADERGRRGGPIGQRPRELTRLLGDPSRVGVRGGAREVHSAGGELDEEQDVKP
jgi:hypothetical protein